MPGLSRLTRQLPAQLTPRPALGLAWVQGAEIPPPSPRAVDFDQEIRPLLENHCTDCHDGEKQKGQLRLDGVAGILKGGDSGTANETLPAYVAIPDAPQSAGNFWGSGYLPAAFQGTDFNASKTR